MNMNRVFDILASLVVLATVTTLILPGRRTRGIITTSGQQFQQSLRTAMGNK